MRTGEASAMMTAMSLAQALGSARASRAVCGASPQTWEEGAKACNGTANQITTVNEQFGGTPNWAREARALPRRSIRRANWR